MTADAATGRGNCAIRRAVAADRPAVEKLLAAESLPLAGVADWLHHFWVAEHGPTLVGVAGMERRAGAALLRSVAVAPAWRGLGVARALVERALRDLDDAGAGDAYLLTEGAEAYFSRLGFIPIDRAQAPAALTASAEFQGACPASAVLMRRRGGEQGL